MNQAFVFIKPHAVTPAVEKLVAEKLKKEGISVLKDGSLTGPEIDEKKLIDQHYYAIASKATMLKPKELPVPEDKFKAGFGVEWKDVLAAGDAYNAMDGCEVLGVDGAGLDKLWAECKAAKNLIKLGGGFYCGKFDNKGKSIFIFNGFFMSMREKFTSESAALKYFVVEFDPATVAWSDFRGKVLGPTDPAEAPEDSLRGQVLGNWQELGLSAAPNVGDNAVHASASPFEGLAERVNWLSVKISDDPFGAQLLESGVAEEVIEAWTVDPQVVLNAGGDKGSLFDALEDLDCKDCVAKCVELSAFIKA